MTREQRAAQEYIRNTRRQLKLTQEEFAERVFMARETIARYETGKRPIPDRKLLAIQNLLAETME